MRRAAAAAAFIAILAMGFAASAKPARIASTLLCGDQLLLLLADRERIATLSYFANDPYLSAMASAAEGLPRSRGLLEEILPLEPDLVLAGTFAARPTTAALRRLGRPVLELPVAETFDDVRRNIRLVGDALGETERAEAAIAAFDAALPPAGPVRPDAPVVALYWSKGYTPASASLAGAAARRAGLRDLAGALGYPGAARVSLETLLQAEPDILAKASRGPDALSDLPLRHPALRSRFGGARSVVIPDRLWICGAPFVADAVRMLQRARELSPQ